MSKIIISCGHESSISLEVFLKSFFSLNKKQQEKIELHVFKEDLLKTANFCNIRVKSHADYIVSNNQKLNCVFLNENKRPKSTISLESCLHKITSRDILVTLPTSKDQLILNNKNTLGHTDYFRRYYNKPNILMFFSSDLQNTAILTEHISINEVTTVLSEEFIVNKIHNLISKRKLFSPEITEFMFSGINPHCGEDGLISNDDQVIKKAIEKLSIDFPQLKFTGPVSGDILLQQIGFKRNICPIFASHDQGLAPFKLLSGILGVNISLGLPFLRLSPDHGTAFDLYGKNKANFFGTFYTIKRALEFLQNEHY